MHFVIQDADWSSSELAQRIANLPKLKHFYLLFLTSVVPSAQEATQQINKLPTRIQVVPCTTPSEAAQQIAKLGSARAQAERTESFFAQRSDALASASSAAKLIQHTDGLWNAADLEEETKFQLLNTANSIAAISARTVEELLEICPLDRAQIQHCSDFFHLCDSASH